jgi:hypothetical protein
LIFLFLFILNIIQNIYELIYLYKLRIKDKKDFQNQIILN